MKIIFYNNEPIEELKEKLVIVDNIVDYNNLRLKCDVRYIAENLNFIEQLLEELQDNSNVSINDLDIQTVSKKIKRIILASSIPSNISKENNELRNNNKEIMEKCKNLECKLEKMKNRKIIRLLNTFKRKKWELDAKIF